MMEAHWTGWEPASLLSWAHPWVPASGIGLLFLVAALLGCAGLVASLGVVGTVADEVGARSGMKLEIPGRGPIGLEQLLVHNAGVEVYRADQPGTVVKFFDLSCQKADEVSYGPYMDFVLELENFEDLRQIEDLRGYVPAYYGANIDYTQKYAFIAMEYVDGQDLTSWCQAGAEAGYPVGWVEDFREAIYETLSIMKRFHQHGIILIDFKPDDIFRLKQGQIKFVDLGSFYTPRHAREPHKFVYATTPDHAELLIDSSNVPTGVPLTEASDIFSAGVALFEMATGASRLVIDGATADEVLADRSIYLFRDSQIRDLWRTNPDLKDALPLIESQLRERRILFAELWHLLKGYLRSKLPDWDTLPGGQQDQIIFSTGTTFIQEQLPPHLQWLAGAIAQATVLRQLRLTDVGHLLHSMAYPASEHARQDVQDHNGLVRCLLALGRSVEFVRSLNRWDVRQNPQSRHWAISATVAAVQLADAAALTFLRQTDQDDQGHRYYGVVEDLEADDFEGGKLCAWHLRSDRLAWIGR